MGASRLHTWVMQVSVSTDASCASVRNDACEAVDPARRELREVVADAPRLPQMDGFVRGARITLEPGQRGTLTDLPALPTEIDAASTARYIRAVVAGDTPVPASIAAQVEHILRLASPS